MTIANNTLFGPLVHFVQDCKATTITIAFTAPHEAEAINTTTLRLSRNVTGKERLLDNHHEEPAIRAQAFHVNLSVQGTCMDYPPK